MMKRWLPILIYMIIFMCIKKILQINIQKGEVTTCSKENINDVEDPDIIDDRSDYELKRAQQISKNLALIDRQFKYSEQYNNYDGVNGFFAIAFKH